MRKEHEHHVEQALFPLGQTVMTRGVAALVGEGKVNPTFLLVRHQSGDWGDLDEEDKHMNDLSLKEEGRIFSAYQLPNGIKIWVITEWDRSATTLLLPDEY